MIRSAHVLQVQSLKITYNSNSIVINNIICYMYITCRKQLSNEMAKYMCLHKLCVVAFPLICLGLNMPLDI